MYETKEYTLGSGHLHVELRDAATFDPDTYEWDKFFTSQTNLIGSSGRLKRRRCGLTMTSRKSIIIWETTIFSLLIIKTAFSI